MFNFAAKLNNLIHTTMCKKCICLIRVSTQHQSLTEQRDKVVATAIADGYSKSEIAVVEGKESAIKLKEEQRETLNEMKNIIEENPSIESVYVFAIDRLARRVSVVLSVKDYLLERGINLVFINPHKMGTMRKDEKTGKMVEDELTKLLLMLLSYGAEMEMSIKKARFATARDALKAQGKIATGVALYGYYRASDGKATIKEEEAECVRDVFNIYANENISLQGLFKRMVAMGKWENNVTPMAMSTRVRNIITNMAYSGGTPTQRLKGKGERTEVYPAIVSEELQQKALAKLQTNAKKPKTTSKHLYFGKGLVKFEMESGKQYAMAPVRRNVNYAIMNGIVKAGVNLNIIDSILWDEAVTLKRHHMNVDVKQTRETYIETIAQNKEQIAAIQPKLDVIKERQAKAFQMLMKGKVSEDIYDATMKDIANDEQTYSKQIAKLETANKHMQTMLEEMTDATILESNLAQITDDEERVKIINQVIEMVIVRKVEQADKRAFKYTIEVVPKDVLKPFYTPHHFIYWASGGIFNLYLDLNGHLSNQSFIIEKRFKAYDR